MVSVDVKHHVYLFDEACNEELDLPQTYQDRTMALTARDFQQSGTWFVWCPRYPTAGMTVTVLSDQCPLVCTVVNVSYDKCR